MSNYTDGSKKFDEHPTWRFVSFYREQFKLLLDDLDKAGIFFGQEREVIHEAHARTTGLLMAVEEVLIKQDLE